MSLQSLLSLVAFILYIIWLFQVRKSGGRWSGTPVKLTVFVMALLLLCLANLVTLLKHERIHDFMPLSIVLAYILYHIGLYLNRKKIVVLSDKIANNVFFLAFCLALSDVIGFAIYAAIAHNSFGQENVLRVVSGITGVGIVIAAFLFGITNSFVNDKNSKVS
jgi:ATP/ADP translocase